MIKKGDKIICIFSSGKIRIGEFVEFAKPQEQIRPRISFTQPIKYTQTFEGSLLIPYDKDLLEIIKNFVKRRSQIKSILNAFKKMDIRHESES